MVVGSADRSLRFRGSISHTLNGFRDLKLQNMSYLDLLAFMSDIEAMLTFYGSSVQLLGLEFSGLHAVPKSYKQSF